MAVSTETYTEAFTEVLLRQQAEVAELEARLLEARGGIATLPGALGAAVLQAAAHPVCKWPGYAQLPFPLAPNQAYAAGPGLGAGFGPQPAQPGPPPIEQPLAWPRPMHLDLKASPDNVLVERRRTFGDREFRLWVEDLAERGGIRIYAMDTVSFARMHTDVKDSDIQLMFNQYWWKMSRKRSGDHSEQLTEFLGTLLDAAYLELEGGDLELRIPRVVEPPKPAPLAEEMRGGWMFFNSKGWIRDSVLNSSASRTSSSSRPGGARPQRRPPTAGEARRPVRPQSAQSGRPMRPRPQSARELSSWEPLLAPRSVPSRPRSAASGGSAGGGSASAAPLGPTQQGGLDMTRRPVMQDAPELLAGPSAPPPPLRPSSVLAARRRSAEERSSSSAAEEVSDRLHSAHTFASISRFPGRAMSGGG